MKHKYILTYLFNSNEDQFYELSTRAKFNSKDRLSDIKKFQDLKVSHHKFFILLKYKTYRIRVRSLIIVFKPSDYLI